MSTKRNIGNEIIQSMRDAVKYMRVNKKKAATHKIVIPDVINVNLQFRKATRDDVPNIIRLLADDPLDAERENYIDPLPPQYYAAFNEINSDKNNYLIVAELENQVIGTLQLTLTPYLTYQGSKRALIEGVRTDKSVRGQGVGKAMLEWAIHKAKEEGCHVVQLTTDKKRPDALEFYKKLGFVASHEGMKLHL